MMNKDNKEVRRLAILKTSTASIPTMSLLNFSLEILKTSTSPITVEALFEVAEKIVERLPELKEKIDREIVYSAERLESWVVEKEEAQEEEPTSPQEEEKEEKPIIPEEEEKKEKPTISEEEKPTIPEKIRENGTVVGKIEAIARTGTGVKIGNEWYNFMRNTKRELSNLEKGMKVEIQYVKTEKGNLIKLIKGV